MDEGLMGQGVLGILDGSSWPILFYNNGLPEEPLSYYLSALSVSLFGQSTFAMRLPNALLGTLTIPLVWLCARMFLTPRAAVIAALYFATFRWHFHFSRLGFRTLLAPLFCLFIFWALAQFLVRGKLVWAGLGGLFLGASLYTYTGMRPVVVAIILWISVALLARTVKRLPANHTDSENDRFLPMKGFALILGVMLLVVAPLGLHFLKNPEHFSSRQNDVTLFNDEGFQWGLFGRHARDVALMGILRGDDEIKHNLPGGPLFGQAYLWNTDSVTEFFEWQALKDTGLVPEAAVTPEGRLDPNGFGHPVFDLITGVLFYLGLGIFVVQALRGSALSWGLVIWLCAGSANSVFSQGAPNQLRMLMVSPLACFAVAQGLEFLLAKVHFWRSKERDLAVVILLWGWFSAGEIHRYFSEWANHPDLGRAFNLDFTEVANWLNENGRDQPLIIGPEFFVQFTTVDFLSRGLVPLKADSKANEAFVDPFEKGNWLLLTNTQYFPPLQLSIPEDKQLKTIKTFSHEGKFIWLTVVEVE